MCLAILSFRERDEWPLFLAANRDEAYARPSSGPELTRAGELLVLAPRDLVAGGTWLGVNSAGLLAVVTNRSDLPQERTDSTPSRGMLVRDVLRARSSDEAREVVEERRWRDSLAFNLAVGTTEALFVVEHVEGGVRVRDLDPGLHVVSNLGLMSDPVPQLARARELWQHIEDPWHGSPSVLADRHDSAPLCRRGTERGTVSASLVGIAPGGTVRFLHAGGAPDETPFTVIHDGVLQ